MTQHFRPAIVLVILFTLLLGIAYPLLVTAVGQVAFPYQANGSLERQGGRVIGSALIGQGFTNPAYFHGRPSAAGTNGYDASASSGSNLGPASKALIDRTRVAVDQARSDGAAGPLPPDLATASGSGLDPDISPAAAYAQVARVAKARGVPAAQVGTLVANAVRQPILGFLGEPRVNVLALNRQLDRFAPKPGR